MREGHTFLLIYSSASSFFKVVFLVVLLGMFLSLPISLSLFSSIIILLNIIFIVSYYSQKSLMQLQRGIELVTNMGERKYVTLSSIFLALYSPRSPIFSCSLSFSTPSSHPIH